MDNKGFQKWLSAIDSLSSDQLLLGNQYDHILTAIQIQNDLALNSC